MSKEYIDEEAVKRIEKIVQQESIDNANPSEALECLEKLKGMEISSMPFSDEYGTQEVDLNDIRKVGSQLNTDFREYTTTIKQALLKAQESKQYVDELKLVEKKLKALEIIKEKECDVRWLKFCIKGNAEVETYNSGHGYRKKLTEEEFDTLKEMLMKYRVSRCADSPKKRKLKGCSTWGYKIVDTKEEAKNLAKEWKQLGYYTEIKEVLE